MPPLILQLIGFALFALLVLNAGYIAVLVVIIGVEIQLRQMKPSAPGGE